MDRGRGGETGRACVRPTAAASTLPLPLPPGHPLVHGHSHLAPNPLSGVPAEKTHQGSRAGGRGPRRCTALLPPQDAAPCDYTGMGTPCSMTTLTPGWHAALGSGGMGKPSIWGCAWHQKRAVTMGAKSLPPFLSFRCTCVSKIRAEATSYGEWALKTIFAASPTCKTPNGMSIYILTDLPWQLRTGAETSFLSSQLKTQRENRCVTAEELASVLLYNQM